MKNNIYIIKLEEIIYAQVVVFPLRIMVKDDKNGG